MNSEKVKEIKKALKFCTSLKKRCRDCSYSEIGCYKLFKDILTIINELESENERLQDKNYQLEQNLGQCENGYKLELHTERLIHKQLKDRIAELESELEKEQINNLNCDTELQYKEKRIAELLKKQEFYETEKLKQFADRLKEKFYYVFGNEYEQSVSGFNTKVLIEDIDETLKEFINKGE